MKKILSGPQNLITDVKGISVGSAEDTNLCTGVTVICPRDFAYAAIDVRGGGPGTKETDILNLESSIGKVNAIVLSGGSSFGLDASTEIQRLLKKDNIGYEVGKNIIPLVPSAVIFDIKPDFNYWKKRQSIWKFLAKKAYSSLSKSFKLGTAGAGYGANTSTLKGGLGSASFIQNYSHDRNYTVGALVVNNAVGNPLMNLTPYFLSGYLEMNNEFGGMGSCHETYDGKIRAKRINHQNNIEINTINAIIATDAPLDRLGLKRLAIMGHNGIAQSIHPAHTPMDGDTVFAISTNDFDKSSKILSKSELMILGSRASDCVARACNRAVYEACSIKNSKPSWKDLFN